MLALAGMNVAGVAVFASIYAAAGARLLNQAAFLASLVVFSIASRPCGCGSSAPGAGSVIR